MINYRYKIIEDDMKFILLLVNFDVSHKISKACMHTIVTKYFYLLDDRKTVLQELFL